MFEVAVVDGIELGVEEGFVVLEVHYMQSSEYPKVEVSSGTYPRPLRVHYTSNPPNYEIDLDLLDPPSTSSPSAFDAAQS